MIRIALFPVSVETLPIARYINNYSKDYLVTTLLALPGTGLCGKDAGYADNRGTTGMIISESANDTKTQWDALFVAEHTDVDGMAHIHNLLVEQINSALRISKDVVCAAQLTPQELEGIFRFAKNENRSFTYLPESIISLDKRNNGPLFHPQPYVVFVGGILRETNSFEVFLSIVGEMSSKHSLNVLSFSTNTNCTLCESIDLSQAFRLKEYTETEMIYAMNELIKRQCEKLLPDIIIVHISEPMIEYNEDITNGFGVIPYMVSKAMIPDYFICGIPYGYGYNENINAISEGMAGRFDYGIDYVHLSNAEFDLSALSNNDITLVTYTTFDAVKRQIDNYCMDSNICVCNMLINDELMNVTGILAENVNKHKTVISII